MVSRMFQFLTDSRNFRMTLCLIIALAVTFPVLPSTSGAWAQEGAAVLNDESYVLEYANTNLAGSGTEAIPCDFITVAYTLADAGALETATLDALWESESSAAAYLAQFVDYSLLYSLDSSADYFVGRVDASLDSFSVADWMAGENSNYANEYSDIEFDAETGLVYVPKRYCTTNDEGQLVVNSTKIQLLYTAETVDDALESKATFDFSLTAEGVSNVASDGQCSTSPYDTATYVSLLEEDGPLDADAVERVVINGVEYGADDGVWKLDEETGQLAIVMYPAAIRSLEVTLADESSLLDKLRSWLNIEDAYGADWSDSSNWSSEIPSVDGVFTFSETPAAGNYFELGSASVYYNMNGDYSSYYDDDDWINTVVPNFADSVEDDYTDGRTACLIRIITAYSSYDELVAACYFNTVYDPAESSTTNAPYLRAKIYAGTYTDDDDTYSVTIPSTVKLLLSCAHYGDTVSDVLDEAEGAIMRVLAVDTSTQTAIVGFATTALYTQSGAGIVKISYVAEGYIEIEKESADTSITDDNSNYSLKGAVYGIYSDKSCTTLVDTLTTNAKGYAKSDALEIGTYYLQEITASKNYQLDETVYTVEVNSDITTTKAVEEVPYVGWIAIEKTSENTGITANNDCYSLAGAVYGIYSDESCTDLVQELTTDAEGYAISDDLPIATYYVKEITPPEGYEVDTTVYTAKVSADVITTKAFSDVPAVDTPDVVLEKLDIESGFSTALGAATLQGAQFSIDYYDGQYSTAEAAQSSGSAVRSWVFQTVYDEGSDSYVLDITNSGCFVSGSALYTTSDGVVALPIGTYVIQEVAEPTGYLLNTDDDTAENDGPWVCWVTQSDDGTASETFATLTAEDAIAEQVKRGDYAFIKKLETTQESLENCVFLITAHATGEAHVAVTDENGEFQTASSFNKHTYHTNENDAAVTQENDGSYTVDEALLNSSYGIWFGQYTTASDSGITSANNSLGALPYDTYTITELETSVNEGLVMLEWTVVVSRDGYTIDGGTIVNANEVTPALATMAADEFDGDSYVTAQPETSITDTVYYYNTVVGDTYTVCGQLVNHTTGDVVATSELSFESEGSGIVYATFDIDASELGGITLDVVEALYDTDGNKVAEHNEAFDDTGQAVYVVEPSIETQAADGYDGDSTVVVSSETTVVDTVSYTQLTPGRTYTLTGTLHVKSNDSEGNVIDGGVLTDAEGNEVTASTTFTPSSATGSVELSFTFNSTLLENNTEIVAFESVSYNDIEVAVHASITDENQTVVFVVPSIETQATNAEDGSKQVLASDSVSVLDTVTYTNLLPGKSYTLKGVLMNKQTESSLLSKGSTVEAKTTFTANKASGSVSVTFVFDASAFTAGAEFVAFEYVYLDGELIASHEDMESESQTVVVYEISSDEPQDGSDGSGSTYDKTGSSMLPLATLGVALATLGASCVIFAIRRYRHGVFVRKRLLR